jgi:polar amino acid transport system substrate-binding protein
MQAMIRRIPSSPSRFIAACVVFCAACAAWPTQAAEELKIATQDSVRPSSIMAERILTLAYQRLGVRVNFIPLPNRRALQMAGDSGADGISFRLIDDGKANLQKIGVPITYEDAVVFTAGKQFEVAGFASLKPYLIGFVSGIPYLEAKLQGMQTDVAPNLESLFRKLEAGRTDIAIDSRFSLCTVKKLGLNKITILEPSLEKRLGYHFIHKRYRALIPRLKTVLHSMEADGTIKRIQDETMRDFLARCGQ